MSPAPVRTRNDHGHQGSQHSSVLSKVARVCGCRGLTGTHPEAGFAQGHSTSTLQWGAVAAASSADPDLDPSGTWTPASSHIPQLTGPWDLHRAHTCVYTAGTPALGPKH